MNDHLLSPADLIRITGAKRYSKQRRWFKEEFGVDVTCNRRGEVILTWAVYDALVLRKWGIAPTGPTPPRDFELFYD